MTRKYFRKYTIELVKEDETEYDGRVTCSTDVYKKLLEVFRLDKKAEEYFVMFCLDTKNNITGAFMIFKGNLNSIQMSPVEVIKRALLCNSQKIIVAHNHPSGDAMPSDEDVKCTQRLKEVCEIMDITLLDHLIIGNNDFKSIMN